MLTVPSQIKYAIVHDTFLASFPGLSSSLVPSLSTAQNLRRRKAGYEAIILLHVGLSSQHLQYEKPGNNEPRRNEATIILLLFAVCLKVSVYGTHVVC